MLAFALGCSFDLGGTPRPDSDGGLPDGPAGDGAVPDGGGGGVTFLPPQSLPTDVDPFGVAVADLDADGRLDIATANFTTQAVTLLLQKTRGNFTQRIV